MIWTPQLIADTLNRLPMVEWDRFIRTLIDGVGDHFEAYGWIGRPADDGSRDFVAVEFAPWSDDPGFVTSSSEHSPTINRILYGDVPHNDCVSIRELGAPVDRLVEWQR